MKIIENFLTKNPYSRPGTKLKFVSKIAIHYVGNPGSTANGNRNYFENLKNTKKTYASSHYIIGLEGEIIQCIPENEIAYCTNSANDYSISIENCHLYSDGKFTEATLNSLIELCADLCERYNLDPYKDIIRHYDVTGKLCPLYFVNHYDAYMEFKDAVYKKLNGKSIILQEAIDEMQIQELSDRVNKLEKNKEPVYNKIDEVPDWGKPTVNKLIAKGYLKGDKLDGGLGISYTLLRLLVINDRAGLYK